MTEISMGEATKAAQGYATQVWIPRETTPTTRDIVALMHVRPDMEPQPGVFFMPGNRISRLFTPGSEQQTVELNGLRCRLRIPDSVLWANHGGPCESRGAEYTKIHEGIVARVGNLLRLGQGPIVMPGRILGTKTDYKGPFDYTLPTEALRPGERPRLTLMDWKLLGK